MSWKRRLQRTVRYVWQTNDQLRSPLEHLLDPTKKDLIFKVICKSDDAFERLIHEQSLITHFGGPKGGQLLNKINALSKKMRVLLQ